MGGGGRSVSEHACCLARPPARQCGFDRRTSRRNAPWSDMPMKGTCFARHLFARNPCVLIQSMHMLCVEPNFGAESRAALNSPLRGQYQSLSPAGRGMRASVRPLMSLRLNFESLKLVAAVEIEQNRKQNRTQQEMQSKQNCIFGLDKGSFLAG